MEKKKNCKLCIFCSLPTWSHKLGIKTLTLLTTNDCWETIRRFNIMAVQGTFCPFKRKSETKFQKGLLVSKSFSFSICFSPVCWIFFFLFPFKILAHPILFGSRCYPVGSLWFSDRGTYYLRALSISINASPFWAGQLVWLLQGGTEGSAHTPQKTKVIFATKSP